MAKKADAKKSAAPKVKKGAVSSVAVPAAEETPVVTPVVDQPAAEVVVVAPEDPLVAHPPAETPRAALLPANLATFASPEPSMVRGWFEDTRGPEQEMVPDHFSEAPSVLSRADMENIMRAVSVATAHHQPLQAPMVTQLEERSSAMERQLRGQLEAAIGTVEVPILGGEVWEAVMGVTAPTEVRETVRRIRARGREWTDMIDMFVLAGKGQVPSCLVGDAQATAPARWGARIVLYELGLAVFDAILRVEAPGVDARSIMAAVDSAGRETGSSALARSLIMATKGLPASRIGGAPPPARPAPVPVQGSASGNGGFRHIPSALLRPASTPPVCHLCHQPGHFRANCPRRR
jgi:hypothetical protein